MSSPLRLAVLPAYADLAARIAAFAADFPDGVEGVRSVAYPCPDFDFDGLEPNGAGTCDGDGHYLCRECSHLSRRGPNWPEEPE